MRTPADTTMLRLTQTVHNLLLGTPRLNTSADKRALPADGLYVFFERGEFVNVGDRHIERIVRVGTHRKDGRFPGRIRDHFSGNSRASVFRRHLGGALLARDDPHDLRIDPWMSGTRPDFPEVEERVGQELREQFTFCAIPVAHASEGLRLERGLIALLAQEPLGPPSRAWLGRHALRPEIRDSGLWNTQHLKAKPLDDAGLARLRDLVAAIPIEGAG